MKVQFEAGRLRLRVTRAELESLRTGGTLVTALDWPGGGWRVEVGTASEFRGDAASRTLRLALAHASLDALAARLPSRDGLRETIALPTGAIELRFEVDLHDGRRPR
jgi:hypothetical protein